ncbi:phasin family protein [Granulosicoccaceae sp. 1_MG-2023]|nr:phasin family protein [Granulosicoccaceae sp. 1_MG-2023]
MATNKVEFPKADELLAPMKALNELALSNAEKMIKLQSQNFEKYSKLALNNFQEASTVSDVEASKAFFSKQGELSKKVAEDVAADLKTFADLGQSYVAEVQKVVSENIAKYGKTA